MVKVLIYSSKEIYDTAGYEGRAEADIIAYSTDDSYYKVVKNSNDTGYLSFTSRTDLEKYGTIAKFTLKRHIEKLERDEN